MYTFFNTLAGLWVSHACLLVFSKKKKIEVQGGGGQNSPRTAFCIPINARPSSQIGENLEAVNPKSRSEIKT